MEGAANFTRLGQLTDCIRGGYYRFQVTGMIEWGQKSKPKIISRASNNLPENPWTKKKKKTNPMLDLRALKISGKH